jgi:L-xylulokinase
MRMPSYFMGIDNGGTLTKACIFDQDGREIGGASRGVPLSMPRPGFTERDMETLWRANCEAIREAISSSGIEPEDLRGLACTGHGKGLYLWGRDGKPARPGIVSTDSRAASITEAWNRDGTAKKAFELTCQSVLACQPVSLLRWIKDNEPGVLEASRWIFEVKDYIRFRLTGEAYAEVSDYSGSSLMNLRERRFDDRLLELFGIEGLGGLLPPIRGSTEACGSVSEEAARATGLPAGLPVAGGMFDIDACAVAMDVLDEENICVIAGTWSINEYVSRKPVVDGSVLMNSLFCAPGYFLVEECSPTSAGNNEWFTKLFLREELREAEARGMGVYELAGELAASVPADGQDIVFLPYVFGSQYDPRAKACFVGMDATATRAQLIRAVYEGVALGHRVHVVKLLASRAAPRAARLAGGAAKSPLWAQMFADVLELPVETVDANELGALGCAMAAAVASGFYRDLEEAASRMMRVGRRFEPSAAASAIYRRKYERQKTVSAALAGLWAGEGA